MRRHALVNGLSPLDADYSVASDFGVEGICDCGIRTNGVTRISRHTIENVPNSGAIMKIVSVGITSC